jgi:hypothetical protein
VIRLTFMPSWFKTEPPDKPISKWANFPAHRFPFARSASCAVFQ